MHTLKTIVIAVALAGTYIPECLALVLYSLIKVPLSIQVKHRLSIASWYNSWDVVFKAESEVKHVGGAVLPGQRVEYLCVNPDLNVRPFCVTNLRGKQ